MSTQTVCVWGDVRESTGPVPGDSTGVRAAGEGNRLKAGARHPGNPRPTEAPVLLSPPEVVEVLIPGGEHSALEVLSSPSNLTTEVT